MAQALSAHDSKLVEQDASPVTASPVTETGPLAEFPSPEFASPGTSLTALSTPHLSLAQWLEVSWFYPAGFEKERITETSRAWIVLGNDVVYKFLKAGSDAATTREAFRKRWRASCEELLDNRPFAPDLYLGLRLLRWVDDEPQWISETPGFDLNPLAAPTSADDVAIVMRRIPDTGRLSHQLESKRGIPKRQVSHIGRTLAAFHQSIREGRAREGLKRSFEHDPDSALTALRDRYVGSMAAFVSEFGTFLDPFSQIAFHEVRSYLSSFFAHHAERFLARGRAGFILDGHGALRAERIVYFGSKTPQFATRLARGSADRSDDVLADLALLTVDLEARGLPHVARELESSFFQASVEGTHEPKLYRFYKAACAMRCAEQLLRGAFESRETSATSFLSTAFRHATGLTSPFLLGIGGGDTEVQLALARGVSEFVSLATLTAEGLNSLQGAPDDLVLDRLLESASRKILGGNSVALVWPFNRDEERALLARAAKRLGVPHLLVQCSGHSSSTRRFVAEPSPWAPPCSAPSLPILHLTSELPPPELAFRVIDRLRSGVALSRGSKSPHRYS